MGELDIFHMILLKFKKVKLFLFNFKMHMKLINLFIILKGLLWNQRENCYVGYLDFENEMQDYQSFALQCQNEIHTTFDRNNSLPNSTAEKQEQSLATQIHQ